MIQTKGFIVTYYGDATVGVSDQSWSIRPRNERDLMQFETQDDLDHFKGLLAGAFELCSDTPTLVETIEEAEFNGGEQPL